MQIHSVKAEPRLAGDWGRARSRGRREVTKGHTKTLGADFIILTVTVLPLIYKFDKTYQIQLHFKYVYLIIYLKVVVIFF